MMLQVRNNESIGRSANLCGRTTTSTASMPKIPSTAPMYPSYIPLFPWNLHETLEDNKDDTIVTWIPRQDEDGVSLPPNEFKILNQDAFVNCLLKKNFQQTKFKSFQRQLNLWGFERTKNGGYTNQFFVKGKKSLCQYMTRKQRSKTSAKKTTQSNKKKTTDAKKKIDTKKQINAPRMTISSSSSPLDQVFMSEPIPGPLPALVSQVSDFSISSKADEIDTPEPVAYAYPVYNTPGNSDHNSSCAINIVEQDDEEENNFAAPIELESIPIELEGSLFETDFLWGKRFYVVE